jgi:hypothetical protein
MTTFSNALFPLRWRWVIASTLLLRVSGSCGEPPGTLKYEEPKRLVGAIYTADRKKILFRFSRVSVRHGNSLSVSRDYTYPDGNLAAKERVLYEKDQLAEYDIEHLQQGARGSARIIDLPNEPPKRLISFQYLKDASSTTPKTATEPFQSNCLISDMVAPFLIDHWGELLKGEKVNCRYVVVDRRETVGFTFIKDSEGRRGNHSVIIIKMFPTSRIISALIDPLFFSIEKDGQRRILEYSGRTAVKVKDGRKWKDLDGITVFEWEKK